MARFDFSFGDAVRVVFGRVGCERAAAAVAAAATTV